MKTLSAVVAAVATVAALAVVGGSATASPARDALIRPGSGIGKVRLGMTLREVRAILGAPSRVQLREEYGFGNHFTWYVWRSGWEVSVRGHRDRARVLRVATSLRRERTPGGFGVGSSDRELKRRLGARCLDYDGQPDESGRVWAPSIGKDHIFCVLGGRGWHGYHTVFTAEETCPGFVLAPHQKCPMKRRVYRVFEVAVQQPQR